MIPRLAVAWRPADLPFLLRSDATIIAADRGTGKTIYLLEYIRETCGPDAFIVCPSQDQAQSLARTAHFHVPAVVHYGSDTSPKPKVPVCFAASELDRKIRGNDWPIFCDEWNGLTPKQQDDIWRTGRLRKAVTS